ncbi:hypothetical protein DPMN_175669 [Dreissena polymorpha]|uniref:Uncharacterized protein n=1 Tax=Dreissena polymorpha TaxID=45954 RepID=A0A9D4IG92_DREPO|nr:hypothetical protein DPMN_175669 [Dreissena polymorpha]
MLSSLTALALEDNETNKGKKCEMALHLLRQTMLSPVVVSFLNFKSYVFDEDRV